MSDTQENGNNNLSGDRLDQIFKMQGDLANYIFAKSGIRDEEGKVLQWETIAAQAKAGDLRAQGLVNRWCRETITAIRDEMNEAEELLPWKYWTRDQVGEKVYPDQTPDQRRNQVLLEFIDTFHFVLEGMMFLGATADDIFNVYSAKWEKNMRRQDTGEYKTMTKTNADNDELVNHLTAMNA